MFNANEIIQETAQTDLMTTDEVAMALRCCPRSVAYLLSRQLVKKLKFGRKVFVHRSEVSRLLRNGVPSIRTSKAVR